MKKLLIAGVTLLALGGQGHASIFCVAPTVSIPLRSGPGFVFKHKAHLPLGDYLEADGRKGGWTHIISGNRRDGQTGRVTYDGWARSVYLKEFACEDESEED
jgi:hypothetical protein